MKISFNTNHLVDTSSVAVIIKLTHSKLSFIFNSAISTSY